ncbi:sensor histidine kinase [Actinomadura yumaensis]|uniref:sensor histidine kinase n=1 Tax=Actinomadura yumaensis TaxID=111807 RepID=UPI00360A5F8F
MPEAVRWLGEVLEVAQLQKEISEAMNRITALLDSARQYSQLDRAPYQRCDLRELLDSTLTMLKRKIGPGVTVRTDYDPDLPAVPVYAAELNQVWTNLIVNALYAMGGSGTLTVRTARENDQAVVEIADTGTGIAQDDLGRIFNPFFTTKPVGQGTGLGLDISWRIIADRHNGDIRVRSEPGDTRFEVVLPLTEPAAPSRPPAFGSGSRLVTSCATRALYAADNARGTFSLPRTSVRSVAVVGFVVTGSHRSARRNLPPAGPLPGPASVPGPPLRAEVARRAGAVRSDAPGPDRPGPRLPHPTARRAKPPGGRRVCPVCRAVSRTGVPGGCRRGRVRGRCAGRRPTPGGRGAR